MTREKALDTGIFLVANTLGALLVPVENAIRKVAFAVDDLEYACEEVVGGYRWKYRDPEVKP